MRLHFRNRMFCCDKLLQYVALSLFYLLLTILPYISGYHIEPVIKPTINEFFAEVQEVFAFLSVFCAGIGALICQIIDVFTGIVFSSYSKRQFLNSTCLKAIAFEKCDLDISNPFLYSSKTMGLLE